jgi:hypothetical protein
MIGGIAAQLAPKNLNDLSVRSIDINKAGTQLYPKDYPVQHGLHFNLGIERQIQKDLIAIKALQRAEQRESTRVKTCITDLLIPELQESLSSHFNDEKNGTPYINSIVHFMSERI